MIPELIAQELDMIGLGLLALVIALGCACVLIVRQAKRVEKFESQLFRELDDMAKRSDENWSAACGMVDQLVGKVEHQQDSLIGIIERLSELHTHVSELDRGAGKRFDQLNGHLMQLRGRCYGHYTVATIQVMNRVGAWKVAQVIVPNGVAGLVSTDPDILVNVLHSTHVPIQWLQGKQLYTEISPELWWQVRAALNYPVFANLYDMHTADEHPLTGTGSFAPDDVAEQVDQQVQTEEGSEGDEITT